MAEIKNILTVDFINRYTGIQKINDPIIRNEGVSLFVKREDLNHQNLSGNKWHKLKYNLVFAREQGFDTILTFGGAYSNHIYAVAAAGNLFGFNTIGIIRGEEHLPLNNTLSYAVGEGMQIHYVDRITYRKKMKGEFLTLLEKQYGEFYLIPEGGTNNLAVKGVSEIVSRIDGDFNFICVVPAGTGGTLAGIVSGLRGGNKAIGFSVLRGESFLADEVIKLFNHNSGKAYTNWSINLEYHFGGCAKINLELIEFMERFEVVNDIPIEPVYTGKLFFGIYDLIMNGFFKVGDTILAIHKGGLQGLDGMKNKIAKVKNSRKSIV